MCPEWRLKTQSLGPQALGQCSELTIIPEVLRRMVGHGRGHTQKPTGSASGSRSQEDRAEAMTHTPAMVAPSGGEESSAHS